MKLPDHITELFKSRYPDYRIVWSEDRTEVRFGELKRKYGDGRDRWILEKHCPASSYGSPEEWERCKDENGVLILGPYPHEGDWEHCFTFEADGQFINPTHDLVELLCKCIEQGKMHTRSERWAAIRKVKEEQEKQRKREFDDLWDDSRPAPGAKIPDRILQLDSFGGKTSADVPLPLPKQAGKFVQIGVVNADSK